MTPWEPAEGTHHTQHGGAQPKPDGEDTDPSHPPAFEQLPLEFSCLPRRHILRQDISTFIYLIDIFAENSKGQALLSGLDIQQSTKEIEYLPLGVLCLVSIYTEGRQTITK